MNSAKRWNSCTMKITKHCKNKLRNKFIGIFPMFIVWKTNIAKISVFLKNTDSWNPYKIPIAYFTEIGNSVLKFI